MLFKQAFLSCISWTSALGGLPTPQDHPVHHWHLTNHTHTSTFIPLTANGLSRLPPICWLWGSV